MVESVRSYALMLCFLALALVAAGCKSRADTRAIHEQKPGEESRRTVQPVAQPPNTASAQQSPLLNPEKASATAPGTYTVRLETTKGDIDIEVHRDWAPRGADRFYNLVKIGYFNDVAFFRVIDGFMAQTGLHGNPEVNQAWSRQSIIDDPVSESNTRGRVSFATSGKDSRGTQFFVNFGDNSRLDQMGFAPFGEVRDMKAVDALYSGYGESAPRGNGPSQMHIRLKGNDYLRANFPDLDYIKRAIILSQ